MCSRNQSRPVGKGDVCKHTLRLMDVGKALIKVCVVFND